MESGEELVLVRLNVSKLNELIQEGKLLVGDFEIKEVSIEGEQYSNDPRWVDLKSKSAKAYKELKNYEYNKRNEVKG